MAFSTVTTAAALLGSLPDTTVPATYSMSRYLMALRTQRSSWRQNAPIGSNDRMSPESDSSFPIFLALTPHRLALRVFRLKPNLRRPGPIRRVQPLRNDAF